MQLWAQYNVYVLLKSEIFWFKIGPCHVTVCV